MTWFARIAGAIALAVAASQPAAAAEESGVARLARSLLAAEAQDGKASPYLLPIIEELAQAQLRDGALEEATASRRRALDIALAAFGCDSPSAAEAMTALATLDIERGRYLDAEPLLLIAEAALQGRVAADHPAMAAIFAGRARVALARGDRQRAEAWARRAVAIARANTLDRSTAPLRALGRVLTASRQFDEADSVLNEALTQDRKRYGADGGDTARGLSLLGNLRLRQGRPADALPLIEEAAAIDQTRLGPTHPFIADDFHDLGLVYDALKRPGEARRAFTAAIGILQRGGERNTPRLAYAETELSRLDREAGDAAAADALAKDARRILDKVEAEERRREREV